MKMTMYTTCTIIFLMATLPVTNFVQCNEMSNMVSNFWDWWSSFAMDKQEKFTRKLVTKKVDLETQFQGHNCSSKYTDIKDIMLELELAHEILEEKFAPNFARLSSDSTWPALSSLSNENDDLKVLPLLPVVPAIGQPSQLRRDYLESLNSSESHTRCRNLTSQLMQRHRGMIIRYIGAMQHVFLDLSLDQTTTLSIDPKHKLAKLTNNIGSKLENIENYMYELLTVTLKSSRNNEATEKVIKEVYESDRLDGKKLRAVRTIRQTIKGLRYMKNTYYSGYATL